MVGGGNDLHHVKRRGNCPGGQLSGREICPGNMSREEMSGCPIDTGQTVASRRFLIDLFTAISVFL